MSDINEIKRIVNESRVHGVYNWNLETIASLITTIESLKEEIENQREIIAHQGKGLLQERQQVESLKAITELAVKGLKEIRNYKTPRFDSEVAESLIGISQETLHEIARLQNGTT